MPMDVREAGRPEGLGSQLRAWICTVTFGAESVGEVVMESKD